jgi:hypothetical protein
MFFICRRNIALLISKSLLESTQEDKSMDIMMKEISILICMLRKAQQALSMKKLQNASKHSI